MSTQSIIVYRNPAEQAFWESGIMVPLTGSLLAFMIVFVIMHRAVGYTLQRWLKLGVHSYENEIGWTAVAIAGMAAYQTFKMLFI